MPNFYLKYKARIDKLGFVVVLVLFLYVFFTYLFSYIAPFVIGFIISLILFPLARLFSKRFKMKKGLASAICVLLFVVILGLLSTTIVNKIIFEARSFIQSVPFYVDEFLRITAEFRAKLDDMFQTAPEFVRAFIKDANFVSLLTPLSSGVTDGSMRVVTNIPSFLITFLMSLISAFFFIRDREKIFSLIKSKTPAWIAENIKIVRKGMLFAVWGYFKAQLILMSIVSCIVVVGLVIIGYPYALFVGILIAIVDMLPIFGSGSILWPWAAYSFFNGRYVTGIGLLVIYLIVLVTRQILEPRILGSQIGVHPLLTLMAMYIGLKMFGLFGLILGPAIVITIKAVYESRKFAEEESVNVSDPNC
ncbi:MAG: sporulation integral membrane protein YtvI [Clostridiales bacterium]|jgi:sporulation integral membrane protein YtvI|nr:sporulation integral membrane protein YtvI [Clostridiales bacterium]